MALSQITDKIWIGSLLSLRADKTLKSNGVTYVLSALGPNSVDVDASVWSKLPIFGQIKKHFILDVEDLDGVDIMKHFEATNAFIQEALDCGEGVLVHCAAGISRSVTIVCAYLMKTNKWTPGITINFVQSRRPVANPNEGFREQLQAYYDSNFVVSEDSKAYREWKLRYAKRNHSTDATADTPVFTKATAPPLVVTWKHLAPALMKRSGHSSSNMIYQVVAGGNVYGVNEPVADSLMGSNIESVELISTEDEVFYIDSSVLSEILKHIKTRMVSFRCKCCASTLASSGSIVSHQIGTAGQCQHYFVEPVEWMRSELAKGELEGRLSCPKCQRKVGSYMWQGSRCSCGSWVTPSFKLSKAKVDEMATTSKPLL